MRHMIAGTKLNRDSGHRMALYRNLVTDLLGYERITTTEAKAKQARIFAEKMVTLGKKGTLASRRRAAAFLYDERIVEKVMDVYAARYATRNGGYTRIYKLGTRLGDGAEMVIIEMVDSEGIQIVNPNDDAKATKAKAEAKKAAGKKAADKKVVAKKEAAKDKAIKENTAKKTYAKKEEVKADEAAPKKRLSKKTIKED